MKDPFPAIEELLRLEDEVAPFGDFSNCEEQWTSLVEAEDDPRILLAHSLFRLRNLPKLSKRPSVVVGHMNNGNFPNFHTLGLLRVADVVSLSSFPKEADPNPGLDRVYFDWVKDSFPRICRFFPKGFKPDLFWDCQAAHGHFQPRGLEQAPCPIAAGLCHLQHVHACDSIAQIFDFIAPVGKAFNERLESTGRANVLRIPFGLNWGSFHLGFFREQNVSKDIDVSLTFSSSESPVYEGCRSSVFGAVEDFKAKHGGRFKIEISTGLEQGDYHNVLERSRISLNALGVNGPYNYRTCEIMNAGALLLQHDVSGNLIPLDDEEVFVEGEDFLRFRAEDFEKTILQILDSPDRIESIANSGKTKLETEFSYEKLYLRLLRETSEKWEGYERSLSRTDSDYFLGRLFWNQFQDRDMMKLGTGLIANSLDRCIGLSYYSNLLATLPESMTGYGVEWLVDVIRLRDPEMAQQLEGKPINLIAGALFAKDLENAALIWNFIALSAEDGWMPREDLLEIAKANFDNHEWSDYDSNSWFLRHQFRPHWMKDATYHALRYENLTIPLLKNRERGAGEWRIHRDYLLALLSEAGD